MRAGLFALSAAGAAIVLAAAPAAAAGDTGRGGNVSVTPGTVSAGAEIDLRVSGCDGTTGRAHSDAFVAPGVLAPSADQPTLFAEARVKSSVAPGTYEVEVACDGVDGKVKGAVQVLPGSASPAASPTALVHAGGGGAAARLAAAPEGPGTRHAVIGLVLTAIAAVAVALRSVRRRRSSQS
ncbi:hypothetical protein ACIREE_36855 [Streptomyces sp. NPDC102467]|uniref:hypothetical protein n=1 Tax=Streptomyces sp. NPDC102467 TaxID=3366179 RepID=UPI00382195FC